MVLLNLSAKVPWYYEEDIEENAEEVMAPKHSKKNEYAAGNRFAKNAIIFTFIIFVIILIGYFYYHFVPSTVPPASQVYSQPVETLTQPAPTQPAQ